MNLYQFSTTQTMNNKRIKNDKRDTFAIVHPGFHKGHFPLLIQPGEQLQCLRYFTKGIQINVTFQERLATKTLSTGHTIFEMSKHLSPAPILAAGLFAENETFIKL